MKQDLTELGDLAKISYTPVLGHIDEMHRVPGSATYATAAMNYI